MTRSSMPSTSWKTNTWPSVCGPAPIPMVGTSTASVIMAPTKSGTPRSEEHTSELQSHHDLVCRLLLEKKKNKLKTCPTTIVIMRLQDAFFKILPFYALIYFLRRFPYVIFSFDCITSLVGCDIALLVHR